MATTPISNDAIYSRDRALVGLTVLDPALTAARKGDTVRVSQNSSPLTDIQEEIGLLLSQRAGKRQIGQIERRDTRPSNRIVVERIAEYYARLQDAPSHDQLLALVEKLKAFEDIANEQQFGSSEPRSAREKALNDIREALKDSGVTNRQRYMLLQGARMHFEGNSARSGLALLLEQAADRFFDKKTVNGVRADYAMQLHARQAEQRLGTRAEVLRAQYNNMIDGGMKIAKLYEALLKNCKTLDFDRLSDVFLKAAGDDLATVSGRADRAFLRGLMNQLSCLKTLRTALEGCGGLLEQVEEMFPGFVKSAEDETDGRSRGGGSGGDPGEEEKDPSNDQTEDEAWDTKRKASGKAPELLADLLNFCAKSSPSHGDSRKLVRRFESESTPAKALVVYCNGLIALHKNLDDRVFPSDSARLQQSTELLSVSGDYVEIEEREEAECLDTSIVPALFKE
ncbi:MAG: hypothetical protein ABJO09_05555 [Hyphomicrobiales bacterium]|uniref:hypothetical protein n=4 Tax=Pseudomonadota TaxID=1224 RepID=UPI003262F440